MSNYEDLNYHNGYIDTTKAKRVEKSLFNPLIDFLCLGGGFLLILIPITLFLPTDKNTIAQVLFGTTVLAHFINHPHFAHSYHIFYRNFQWKAFANDSPLRLRYIFAGICVPLLLVTFFVYCLFSNQYTLMGFAGNVMVFFVGWHYVKQGYGILMVSSVLKRSFFSESEKKLFLINAYLVWIYSWVVTNQTISASEMWGIEYYTFMFPNWLNWLISIPLVLSSALVGIIFLKKCINDFDAFPKNGAIAYITSLYVWLILIRIHPALLLISPAFHSLQYLVVVWRYEINKSHADYNSDIKTNTKNPISVNRKLFVFAAFGLIAGFFGFWLLPLAMDVFISYEIEGFVNTTFLFIFWIFINIHHYFIDNVIWRKENKDVGQHLFS